jgi:hypothetical protein
MPIRIQSYVLALVVAYFLGPAIAYAFRAFFPLLANDSQMPFTALAYLNFWLPIGAQLPVSVVAAVWLFRAAKEEGKSRWLWAIFAALFQVVAVAVFYAVSAYQRTRSPR